MAIIKGTTPTITFTFDEIAVTDISVAYLVIKQGGKVNIERDLETATVVTTSPSHISWTLTQEETLGLSKNMNADIYCDWKLLDGTRGRSNIRVESVEDTGKNEVI